MKLLKLFFNKIQHRGPDNSIFHEIDASTAVGFHRLSINDTSEHGNQPFIINNTYLICNGEIFNHKTLETEHNITDCLQSHSDCECIIQLFQKHTIEYIVKNLDAEFAFVLYDHNTKQIYAARDPFGVRPLFIGFDNEEIYFASEMKAINFCEYVMPFLPGHYMVLDLSQEITKDNYETYYKKYYHFPTKIIDMSRDDILENIKNKLITAVQKRTMSERPVGCLLSGGLDSSLIASILHRELPNVHFFSIGLRDSVDVIAAKKVIEYLKVDKSRHHIIEFSVEEGFSYIEEVIQQLETYDVTTIRASTPQYIMAKYIRYNTDIKVIYSGESADELFLGYQYSKLAPDAQALLNDSKRLLNELYMFDNLRTDRTTARWGLEVRVPFLDTDLLNFVISVDPELKMCNKQIEKKILRDAFKDKWLPEEILYRCKEAFSDAVSSQKGTKWYPSLQKIIDTIITDDDMKNHKYVINPPLLKEALYYRNIFNKYYPNRDTIISHYWLPKWTNVIDPSATVLSVYKTGYEKSNAD